MTHEDFFASINVNIGILEPLHTGIAIFDGDARLRFANSNYRKMYNLDDKNYMGLDAAAFFITASQGILEVLKTGKANSCASVSITGLYGITYRWPLKDRGGRIAGCMTENISVSSEKNRISEMQSILTELEGYDKFSTLLCPRQSTEVITLDSIVGESPAMRMLKEKGKRFALHDEPILILGENGTGKDLVAQAVHAASSRRNANLVTVNCAAIPHELMESELFGYEAGAFTGAKPGGKKGQFELAEGGTIFLDEVGELPLPLQAKLLRVLENREIHKLGSASPRHVDFRLISATNRNLEHMLAQGLFREDLYYRLNLFDLVVPPLRQRLADIPLLAHAIIARLAGPERGRQIRLEKEVLSLFTAHPWRGNVRELRNIITYALYSMPESASALGIQHLPERFIHATDNNFLCEVLPDKEQVNLRSASVTSAAMLADSRAGAERDTILRALEKCGGNKSHAARLLGVARSNLYKKLATFGITG